MLVYDIVFGEWAEDLKTNVNRKMALGWRPQGGVAIIHEEARERDGGGFTYSFAQAMVKEEK